MLAISHFVIICLLSSTSPILSKYDFQVIIGSIIVFDASGFNEGEEMHFRVKSYESYFTLSDTIEYFYIDEYSTIKDYSSYKTYKTYVTTTSYSDDYVNYYATKYFTIKKQKSEFGTATKGTYLYIYLPLSYYSDWAEVENTEEDEGKLQGWVIAVIVVVIVVIAVIFIIWCCVRRVRRQKQLAQAQAAAVANQNYQAQAIQAQINQAQAIQAQINQAQAQAYQDQVQAQIYQAQAQAYQEQINQAQAQAYQTQVQAQDQGYQSNMNAPPQPYQQQNYQNQGDFTNDAGYSSKAAAI